VSGRSKDQDLIDELAAWMQAPDTEAVRANGHASAKPTTSAPTDEMVIQKCRGAENAAKFVDLFEYGDVHAHHGGDASVADLALLGIMAFYTQDDAQLERLFSSSALGRREKWRQRADYRRRTITRALTNLGEVYDWGRQRSRPLVSSPSSTLGGSSDDDTRSYLINAEVRI
jgi:primase-polymerase (primpol)-like protein